MLVCDRAVAGPLNRHCRQGDAIDHLHMQVLPEDRRDHLGIDHVQHHHQAAALLHPLAQGGTARWIVGQPVPGQDDLVYSVERFRCGRQIPVRDDRHVLRQTVDMADDVREQERLRRLGTAPQEGRRIIGRHVNEKRGGQGTAPIQEGPVADAFVAGRKDQSVLPAGPVEQENLHLSADLAFGGRCRADRQPRPHDRSGRHPQVAAILEFGLILIEENDAGFSRRCAWVCNNEIDRAPPFSDRRACAGNDNALQPEFVAVALGVGTGRRGGHAENPHGGAAKESDHRGGASKVGGSIEVVRRKINPGPRESVSAAKEFAAMLTEYDPSYIKENRHATAHDHAGRARRGADGAGRTRLRGRRAESRREWLPCLVRRKNTRRLGPARRQGEVSGRKAQIIGSAVPNTPNSFLCTRREYGDFILELEFKVDPTLNSGVQVRSQYAEEGKEVESAGKKIKGGPGGRVFGYQVEIDPSERAYTGGVYDEGRRAWLKDLKDNEAAQGLQAERVECARRSSAKDRRSRRG